MSKKEIIDSVNHYYTEKVKEHGPTGKGVDWNGEESQFLRFSQLGKVLPTEGFSILDYGCGYGAFLDYLKPSFKDFQYTGFDISAQMLLEAEKLHSQKGAFTSELQEEQKFDFLVASGLFNVRLDKSDEEWKDYIVQTLDQFDSITTRGFAFNILTSYSDADKQRDYLYYADPLYFFDHCKRNYSKEVALLHDYELYEFTILVRK